MRPGGWLYWVAVGLSGLTLALVVAYIVLVQDNRTVQTQVNQRQQFINQSAQLSRVNEALIRALATATVNNKDDCSEPEFENRARPAECSQVG